MMAGLGAVIVALWRGWTEEEVDRALIAFQDASTGHKAGLLPGSIAVGATGIFLAGDAGYNFITTGWLLALELIYLFVLLICVPLLGHALNRVEIEALKSRKKGEPTAGAAGAGRGQRADRALHPDPVQHPVHDLAAGLQALLVAAESLLRPILEDRSHQCEL